MLLSFCGAPSHSPLAPSRAFTACRSKTILQEYKQRCCRHGVMSSRLHSRPPLPPVAQHLSTSHATETSFPSCFPQEQALEIRDPTAIAMMRTTTVDPIYTSLCKDPIDTAYVAVGATQDIGRPASARTVIVFLHGFDSSCLEFRRMMPFMRESPDVASYFVDILGWGFTSKPSNIAYGVDEKRIHLRAWIKQVIGDIPVVLAGASIGGAVAIDYALAYPSEVSKLILINAQAFTDKLESPIMQYAPWLAKFGAQVLKSRWIRRMAARMSYETSSLVCEDTVNIGRLHCLTDGWVNASVQFVRGFLFLLQYMSKPLFISSP